MDNILSKTALSDDDERQLFGQLQCNTLAPHRRNLSVHLFFQLGANPQKNKEYIQAWAKRATPLENQVAGERQRRVAQFAHVKSAFTAHSLTEKLDAWFELARPRTGSRTPTVLSEALRSFRLTAEAPRGLVRSVMLSSAGLMKLPPWATVRTTGGYPTQDDSWRAGMWAKEPELFSKLSQTDDEKKQTRANWIPPFKDPDNRVELHVLLAADGVTTDGLARPEPTTELASAIAEERKFIDEIGGRLLGEERGYLCPLPGGGFQEHFGYRDGISNVHVLADEISRAQAELGAANRGCTLGNLLFSFNRPGQAESYGSLCVLRKIQEKIGATDELRAAQQGQLTPVIGRKPNGTPLVPTGSGKLDDFNFDEQMDPTGQPIPSGCPFHAHIRKANPRQSSTNRSNEAAVLFARRGMIFGQRDYDVPTGRLGDVREKDGVVGLLFMAYMGSIDTQFAHMQREWLGADNFPRPKPLSGRDELVGLDLPGRLNDYTEVLGGEHFFVPPLAWLLEPGPQNP